MKHLIQWALLAAASRLADVASVLFEVAVSDDDLMAVADAVGVTVEPDEMADYHRAWTEAVDSEVETRHADAPLDFADWEYEMKASQS